MYKREINKKGNKKKRIYLVISILILLNLLLSTIGIVYGIKLNEINKQEYINLDLNDGKEFLFNKENIDLNNLERNKDFNKKICLLDSGYNRKDYYKGYNVLDDSRDIYDNVEHGTILGAILKYFLPNSRLIVIKITDSMEVDSDNFLKGLKKCSK